ncbi:WhiB family transcriptional regulator [Streptomyces sp. NPDC001941]|uniref:WhiB family transcriptional regulator n=1 Tax=Streptomyces sp. NPDC001941 TaxID=3154659 RepID=UPI0033183804
MIDTRWHDEALCAQTDPELFFPPQGGGVLQMAQARAVCAACPVRLPCLEHGVAHGERGVWGGTTDRQRQAIRRARDTRRAAA